MSDLTILLLRDSVKSAEDAIKKALQPILVGDANKPLGTLFVEKGKRKPPKWAKLFFPHVSNISVLGQVQSTGAVFVLKTGERWFAVTFGTGWHLVDPAVVEERFGLLVVLNSVRSDRLRSIDMRSFDAVDQNSRVQTSQMSSASEFGIDIERDLVRAVTGEPTDPTLGKRLTGADPLSVAVSAKLEDLPALCKRYLQQFQSTHYKNAFAWIDNIHQVSPRRQKRDELDQELVAILESARKGTVNDCWMALPNIVDWNRVCRFRFSARQSDDTHTDIHLPGFFESLDPSEPITIDLLKRHLVYAVDTEGLSFDRWTIYECIHCEIDDQGSSFVLSGGLWFEVSKDFVAEVDRYFSRSIARSALKLPEFEHATEGAFNQAVCASDPSRYALMDVKLIPIGGVRQAIEFCDILTNTKQLIHVKKYGGSSLLGHLFNQGLVSGQSLRNDTSFVGKVNVELPDAAFHLIDSAVPRDAEDYTIVFAIISESDKALHIPFFSRVSLRHVHKELISMGFPVELAKISVTSAHKSELKKLRKAKAAKKAAKKAVKKTANAAVAKTAKTAATKRP